MKTIAANVLILAMSVTYFLLAVQAEIVTKTLGYIFGSLLALTLLIAVTKQGKTDA
jgi:fucose permease